MADFRDLISRISDIRNVISSEDLPKNVSGAEDLLERHTEHRSEIEDIFRAAAEAGRMLVDSNHQAATEEVQKKLGVLEHEKNVLQRLWEERRILYEQCKELQLFYQDSRCYNSMSARWCSGLRSDR